MIFSLRYVSYLRWYDLFIAHYWLIGDTFICFFLLVIGITQVNNVFFYLAFLVIVIFLVLLVVVTFSVFILLAFFEIFTTLIIHVICSIAASVSVIIFSIVFPIINFRVIGSFRLVQCSLKALRRGRGFHRVVLLILSFYIHIHMRTTFIFYDLFVYDLMLLVFLRLLTEILTRRDISIGIRRKRYIGASLMQFTIFDAEFNIVVT